MKRKIINLILVIASCFALSCGGGKSNDPAPNNNTGVTGNTGSTGSTGSTGGTGNTNSYVVKTVAISRIVLGVDANFKITVADLYGGGNRVTLKAGTGYTMDMLPGAFGSVPDGLTNAPDGVLAYANKVIDNGIPPTDTSGVSGAVIKLKGFDKAKTGYNQLNLVMYKLVWAVYPGWAGYQNNLTYLTFTRPSGAKNSQYGLTFVKGLFTGNINITNVEIAAPQSANPYITQDQIVSLGQSVYDVANSKALNPDLRSLSFRALFTNSGSLGATKNLKFEWVNANNAVINKLDDYTYEAKFSNIKTGGFDQVVDPADSVSKVFLRIAGLDPKVFGCNQMRLFIGSDGFYDGSLQVIFNAKPSAAPTLSTIKAAYIPANMAVYELGPEWPHY